ncbi:hypothetical protein JR316_0003571 [Psilocybe cubensis]|uniref:Histone H1 n=2 Tax=Psilocybe cubensis TaxID=181762 RepID=A0A8H7Y583_PSICU|nr:hypothetical protein JR316_0003571 [Psilocybe cubensis]KAH9484091.1 hypothetical protein JR316_0003571 [Psilocybe cubensis]
MQVASVPYSAPIPHSHYHSYYQLHPPGPQDHDLKRQYLALLPPHQIIDLCLNFDIHLPPYIKSSLWPPDINAAIAKLRKDPQVSAEPSVEESSKDGEPAVMDSLKSPSRSEPTPAAQGVVSPTEPRPPDKETPPATSEPSSSTTSSAPATESPAASPTQTAPATSSNTTPDVVQPVASTSTSTPAPTSAPTPHPAPAVVPPVHPQYPHQPYGYGHHPQATYPIAPYYAQPPGGYSYQYAPYANPMQTAYHSQPPATYPPQPSIYNSMVPIPHPVQQQQQQDIVNGVDDLPSYEEMIVEALTGCSDPEGWAPKDLFAWMASRYPLQSNFRPSASQALQKAYRRGRFDKGPNGKYRLNPSWEGGNTTRRTTRRPQTQNASTAPTASTPAPPFTHAPLVHHHHGHAATPSTQPAPQPPYSSQPYGYPPYGYPGYPAQPAASTSTAPGTIAGAPTSPSANKATTETSAASAPATETDSADAYEAAQNILSAINFGSMYQLPPEERQKDGQPKDDQPATETSEEITDNGVEHLLSHVQAMLASNAASQSGTTAPASAPSLPQPTNGTSPEDPRAELQAQLALLAAQLAELAQVEDSLARQVSQPQPQLQHTAPAPIAPSLPQQIPPASEPAPVFQNSSSSIVPSEPSAHIHAPTPVVALPQVADVTTDDDVPDPLPEDDDSDDDDMEEII